MNKETMINVDQETMRIFAKRKKHQMNFLHRSDAKSSVDTILSRNSLTRSKVESHLQCRHNLTCYSNMKGGWITQSNLHLVSCWLTISICIGVPSQTKFHVLVRTTNFIFFLSKVSELHFELAGKWTIYFGNCVLCSSSFLAPLMQACNLAFCRVHSASREAYMSSFY
jgi:hypothetical protein